MTVILAGTIGRSGLGGQAWACLQYLLGLRALGHEVVYLEDCGRSSWVYIWETEEWTHELDYPARYVHACLQPFGLGEQWIYRDNYRSLGMPLDCFLEVCQRADLLILRAAPFWTWRAEYDAPSRRAFIDVDPGFTQITLASGDQGWIDGVAHCERRFTIGSNLGSKSCPAPTTGGPWLKTLPPVYLDAWPVVAKAGTDFTSILRWQGFKDVEYEGQHYGQRDREFERYLDLPKLTQQSFTLAQMGADPERLRSHGWLVEPGETVSRTPDTYRQFIQQSRGEISIPKQGYVAMQGGWFSDRSVCYLASGRPVVMADTGLQDWKGAGVVTFRRLEEAVAAISQVNADYTAHCQAARTLAEKRFATGQVLPDLLEAALN